MYIKDVPKKKEKKLKVLLTTLNSQKTTVGIKIQAILKAFGL